VRVALILEGSYPYITGGLSSWVQQLATNLPEIEFGVLSIMPSREKVPEVKYKPPANLVEVKTLFLEDYLQLSPLAATAEPRLSDKQRLAVESLLAFSRDAQWAEAISVLSDQKRIGTAVQFLKSRVAWDFLVRLYQEKFADEEFNRFFWTLVSMYIPLIHLLQQEGIAADVYHPLSTGYAGLIGLKLSLAAGKPLLVTEHGLYAREREEEIISATWVDPAYKQMWIDYFYCLALGAYRHATRVTALFSLNSDIQQYCGVDKHKALIIPNGVDINRFRPVPRQNSTPTVGAILRVVPIKDVKTLLRAFRIVLNSLPAAQLLIIGATDEDYEYYLECRHLVDLLNLSENVTFTGQVNIIEYLPRLDVVVLTSLSEGQPLVMLESMAAGVPVIATDVGSCRELIEGAPGDTLGPAGIIVPPASSDHTAGAILSLLSDPEMQADMGHAARQRVTQYYSQTKFISSYRELYTGFAAMQGGTGLSGAWQSRRSRYGYAQK